MQIQQERQSNDDQLISAVAALRADLIFDYVMCIIDNPQKVVFENHSAYFTYTRCDNTILYNIEHEQESGSSVKFDLTLAIFRKSPPFLRDLIEDTNPDEINLDTLLETLNHTCKMLDKAIDIVPDNQNNWPIFRNLASNSNVALQHNLLTPEECAEITQLLAEQHQRLLTLKTKLTEHLSILTNLQQAADQTISPRMHRDSPVLAQNNASTSNVVEPAHSIIKPAL